MGGVQAITGMEGEVKLLILGPASQQDPVLVAVDAVLCVDVCFTEILSLSFIITSTFFIMSILYFF